MSIGLWVYLAFWLFLCALALFMFVRDPGAYSISSAGYRRFLCVRWKLVTFAIAACGITIVAPYTGDPTWDYIDAAFMSALTFVTAPWSVGTLYRSIRQCRFTRATLLALCLWMFSASWSYDLYLLLRDGYYPDTWFSNIFASSVLYCSAGLLWNLEWRPGRGALFAFQEADWPNVAPHGAFARIGWIAAPFMLLAFIAIASFLVSF